MPRKRQPSPLLDLMVAAEAAQLRAAGWREVSDHGVSYWLSDTEPIRLTRDEAMRQLAIDPLAAETPAPDPCVAWALCATVTGRRPVWCEVALTGSLDGCRQAALLWWDGLTEADRCLVERTVILPAGEDPPAGAGAATWVKRR